MTGKEIRTVTTSMRPELPVEWKTMSATEKTKALLERKDLPQLVQTMAADKLYLMIHEIGVDSSLELFSFVEPDQWKGLVDISCWESDMSSPERFAAWFQAVSLAGAPVAEKFIGAVDEEYLVTVIKSIATVEEKDLDKDFVPDTLEIIPSPDGEFFLLIPRNHTLIPFVVQALKLIFAKDLLKGRRLLRACRTELTTQLTETAFRFRSGRLEDLGFLEFNVAMEILEPIALNELREKLKETVDEANLPRYSSLQSSISGLQLYGEQQSLFLHKVLAAIPSGSQKTNLEEHFTYLINRHCVVTQVDMADAMGIQVGALQTYGMVNLGLQTLVGDHIDSGVKALETLWLKELYRAGYTRLLKLQRDSRQLRSFSGKFALFGHPLESLLDELSGLIPSAIQGFTEDGQRVLRPIATLDELTNISASVKYATVIGTVFRDQLGVSVEDLEKDELPGIPESQRATLTYKTLLLTGLANQLAGRGFTLELLSEIEVEKMSNLLFSGMGDDRKFKAEVREQLVGQLETVVPDAIATVQSFKLFLGQCLDQLETTLKDIPPGEAVDTRFLGNLLLTKDA